ncbi:magnesium transporter [Mycobacteroides immunogenum]|uniref:Magnesium transporter MgtE n=1 Tax=Mycobacteroides immunogenum TaxID=83262 RepID=A0A179V9G5_9MYCO|nr:magnesium transporter [Mycobacteroides immunogenum]
MNVGVLGVLPVRAEALNSVDAVSEWLSSAGTAERGRMVASMSKEQLAHFVSLLSSSTGRDLLGSIDADAAARLVRAAGVQRSRELIEALDYDSAADIVRRLSVAARTDLLNSLSPQYAETLTSLLQWPPESVAAHMIPDVLRIAPGITVPEAQRAVRAQSYVLGARARGSSGAQIYVVDADQRLVAVVGFDDLVLAEQDQIVSEFMSEDPIQVDPLTDAEHAAQILIDYDLQALPVVDQRGEFLGVLTAEAVEDILIEEATEDAERQGGSAPLDVPYLRASPLHLWRKRIVWLLVLFIAEAYTGTVLRAFEDELDAVVALAFFIPLLIGTGGNTGTQITTTLVRAMATGQVRLRDLPRVLAKEISTGALVAVTMASAAIVRAWTLGVGKEVAITVALTIAAIVIWSALVASVLPPLLKKFSVDPAVVSAPMISTIVDGTGLILYFLIAHATLPQLAGL